MAYRQSGETRDLAVDPEEILAAQRRSRRIRLFALAAAVVVLGGAGTTVALVARAKSRAETQRSWDRFATCLVGSLPASEKASLRVRNTQLTAMAVSAERRAAAVEGAWPARCAAPAHGVAEAMRASGGSAALADSSEKLAKAIALDTAVASDLAPLVDKVFADAAAEKLVAARAGDMTTPPEPATPFTLATLPPAARMFASSTLSLSSVRAMPFGDTTVRLLVDDKDFALSPMLCSYTPGASSMACKKVPPPAAQLSPGLRLWGTTAEGAPPHVFAGDRGKAGIFRADTGARVVEKVEYGAYGATSLRDGSFAYLAWHEKPVAETRFVRVDGGKSKETSVVLRKESGNPYYSTSIFWDFVAYKFVKRDVEGIRLVVRPIDASGELGAPVDVGRIDEIGHIEGGTEEEPHLTACRTKDTTVLRAKGWANTFLSFHIAGRWTAPVESQGVRGQLQCRTGEGLVTRVWGGQVGARFKGGITQSRCTVSGCNERTVDIAKMLGDAADVSPHDAKDVRAADIEGKLLVVWRAGDQGGLRMRLAPAEQIGAAADTVLLEDHLRDGVYRVESTVVDFTLVPAPGGVLLLVGTVEGVYAWWVDGSGKPSPVATP